MATEESFSRVLRGYDPAEVDPLVQKLRRELLAAKTIHDETAAQLKELQARLDELELEANVKITPTVEGLSTKLNNKLKIQSFKCNNKNFKLSNKKFKLKHKNLKLRFKLSNKNLS